MLSLPAVVETAASVAGAAELAVVGSPDTVESVAGALVPAGVGVVATSPPLTPERGASATQATKAASGRTPRRVERT